MVYLVFLIFFRYDFLKSCLCYLGLVYDASGMSFCIVQICSNIFVLIRVIMIIPLVVVQVAWVGLLDVWCFGFRV